MRARYPYEGVWIARFGGCHIYRSHLEQRWGLAGKAVTLKYDGLWNRPLAHLMAWFQALPTLRYIRNHLRTEVLSALPDRDSSTWELNWQQIVFRPP